MNGFERHKITHSSPSQVNTWENCPALWVVQKLFHESGARNPAMERGNYVEEAVKEVLLGEALEDATNKVIAAYDTQFVFDADGSVEKNRACIAPMVAQAVEELKPYGKPTFNQGKQIQVSTTLAGESWELPVIGKLDFVFPEHGLIVDLKTTLRAQNVMAANHQRQRCFYAHAQGNQVVKFLYVTAKKSLWLEDGNVADEIESMRRQLDRQEKFLRLGDRELLRDIVPVDASHFYWRGDESLRKKHFNL